MERSSCPIPKASCRVKKPSASASALSRSMRRGSRSGPPRTSRGATAVDDAGGAAAGDGSGPAGRAAVALGSAGRVVLGRRAVPPYAGLPMENRRLPREVHRGECRFLGITWETGRHTPTYRSGCFVASR